MSIINIIKNLFSGNMEGKIAELLSGLVEKIKPLIAEGKVGELLAGAVENFGDLGEKLKDIIAKLTGASKEEKAELVAEKENLVRQVKDKGVALVDAAEQEESLPEAVKAVVSKVKGMLGKL